MNTVTVTFTEAQLRAATTVVGKEVSRQLRLAGPKHIADVEATPLFGAERVMDGTLLAWEQEQDEIAYERAHAADMNPKPFFGNLADEHEWASRQDDKAQNAAVQAALTALVKSHQEEYDALVRQATRDAADLDRAHRLMDKLDAEDDAGVRSDWICELQDIAERPGVSSKVRDDIRAYGIPLEPVRPGVVCKLCHEPLEYMGTRTGWVMVRSGDDGGTYDQCPENWDAEANYNGSHQPTGRPRLATL